VSYPGSVLDMSRRLPSLSGIVFATTSVVVASQAGAPPATTTSSGASATTAAAERALVDRYCVGSAQRKTAGLVLESLDLTWLAAMAPPSSGQYSPAGAAMTPHGVPE